MSEERRSLRVLTANLYAHRLDVEGFRTVLKDLAPDVAVVQELSFRAAEVLAGFLPHGLLVPADGYGGRGLALKAPAQTEPLPMAFRDGLIARLESPVWPGPLEIVNVHMANPIIWPPWRSVGLRQRQLESLLAHITTPRTRLIAGDFNASPIWPVYRRVAARLEDAAVSVATERGVRPSRTWGPTPTFPRMLRIDHVFVDGLRPIDVRRIKIPGSDHSGLLVEVEPERPRPTQ